MVDRNPEQQRDVLDLIGDFGPNKGKDGGANTIEEIRLILEGRDMIVPTLEEVMSSIGGRTEAIVAAHQAPALVTRETPEIAEWRRQTDRFIGLGFHDALQFSDPEMYRLTIPQFFLKPRNYYGNYDKPLAVEGRIPLPKLHQLAGIKDYIDTSKITDRIRRIPKKPYTVYIVNSVETVTGTFDFALGQLTKDAVADTFIEVDMAYLRYPELFQTWLDAGSSRFGADSVPYLDVSGGGPRVDAYWVGRPDGRWRLLSRGQKIGT